LCAYRGKLLYLSAIYYSVGWFLRTYTLVWRFNISACL